MITFKKEEHEQIPAGEHIAQLVKVEPNETKKPSQYGPAYRWSFRLVEGAYAGRAVSGLSPTTWKKGNKLDNWLLAFGINAEIGQEVQESLIVGKYVRIFIEANPNAKWQNVKFLNSLRPEDVVRLSGGQTLQASAPQPTFQAPVAAPAPVTFVQPSAPAPVFAQPAPQTVSAPQPLPAAAPVAKPRSIPF